MNEETIQRRVIRAIVEITVTDTEERACDTVQRDIENRVPGAHVIDVYQQD